MIRLIRPTASIIALGLVVGGVTAASSTSAGLTLAIDVAATGTAPFTKDQVPGGDTGPGDAVVRTNDSVTYRLAVSTEQAIGSMRIVLTAPLHARFAELPNACGDASRLEDDRVECELGVLAAGSARAFPVVLTVLGSAHDGDAVHVEAVASTTTDAATASSVATRVSAAPRYDLTKNAVPPLLRHDVLGPDGTTRGFTVTYPVGVTWRPAVPDDDRLLGYEQLADGISFTDDVAAMAGTTSSDSVLFPDGASACGVNRAGLFPSLPGGAGGGDRNVPDSGAITCSQPSPGAPVTVRITGTDTALTPGAIATAGANGGPIAGGPAAHVVEMYLRLWTPYRTDTPSFTAADTFSELDARSVSGHRNVVDPTENNSMVVPVLIRGHGRAFKAYRRLDDAGVTVDNSARYGDPWLTAGAQMRSDVGLDNDGAESFGRAVLCDVIDNRYQRVRLDGPGTTPAVAEGLSGNGTLQYAARTWTTAAAAQAQPCGDGDARWYSSPEDVPGGPSAVGMVRAVGWLRGGGIARLRTALVVLDAPQGTKVHNFATVSTDGGATWQHDTADPELGLGPLADHLIVTKALVRVEKRIVDPGTDADTTKDETSYAVAGTEVEYALYPSLTTFGTADESGPITVTDSFPPGARYVAGTASREPEHIEGTPSTGQRLVWSFRDVTPGRPIAPITYRAVVPPSPGDGTPVANTVVVESPLDISGEAVRTATRGLHVVRTAGLRVEKRPVAPRIVTGDAAAWDLSVTNDEADPVRDLVAIDALPADHDDNGSSFHGTATLAAAVTVDAAAGEQVRYTARDRGEIDLDPSDPSNAENGSTRWCDQPSFGEPGCPQGLDDVTGVRLDRTGPVAPGQHVGWRLTLATSGAHEGDRYVNRFGAVTADIPLAIRTSPAEVQVVAGSIGDRVWHDLDADGVQDDGEPGAPDIGVRLDGIDDHGDHVRRSTSTDASGSYHLLGLRPGDYVVCITIPEGHEPTVRGAGPDRARDSDLHADGCSGSVLLRRLEDDGALAGVSSTDSVDGGLVAAGAAGVGPSGPGGPGGGAGSGSGTPDQAADAGHRGASARDPVPAPRVLAFTGSGPLMVVLAVALGAVGAGWWLRRRRREGLPEAEGHPAASAD